MLTLHISQTVLDLLASQISIRKGGNAQFIGNIVPLALTDMQHVPAVPLLCVPLLADLDENKLLKNPKTQPPKKTPETKIHHFFAQ